MTINYFIIFPTAVLPGHKISQLRSNNHRLRSGVARWECDNTLERTLHFTGEEARSSCVQLAICLHLRIVCMRRQIQEHLLVLWKRLKGLQENKQLRCLYVYSSSGHTWGATVVSGWTVGLAKIPGYRWCEIKLSCFFHSLTGCNKTSFFLGRGKRWVSFLAETVYFVKMNTLPEKPPTDYLCTIERFIKVLYGRTNKHLHEHRHG